MYHHISGILTHTLDNAVVVECGGVGYKIFTTYTTMHKLVKKDKVTLYTHLNVREDALDLFGFYDEEELSCFKMLISVSGVGPKAALAILSELSPEKFAAALVSQDVKAFTRAQGVGAKLASRIVLELKDKIKGDQLSDMILGGTPDMIAPAGIVSEAVSALVVLGYSQTEARNAVKGIDFTGKTLEDIIRISLKQLIK